jgi:hypothetical protein
MKKCIDCKNHEPYSLQPWRVDYYAGFGIPPEIIKQVCRSCLLKRWRREIRRAFYKRPKKRICRNVGSAIRKSIRTGQELPWWERHLGYTWAQLKRHLEKRFKPGMTWENYGQWHIDHIRPIAAFEFEDYADRGFKRCWSLQNLRPLWAVDNWVKNAQRRVPSLRRGPLEWEPPIPRSQCRRGPCPGPESLEWESDLPHPLSRARGFT